MSGDGDARRSPGRWPTGHFSWFFDGISAFEGAATTFLAEGAGRGERLMLVADDPDAHLWPQSLIERGLIVASTSEIYGTERLVVAEAQRATFAAALDDALALGYRGVRVAADNTSLITDSDRWAAWTGWEDLADRFMAENPVTGMCAFDRSRTDATALVALGPATEQVERRDGGGAFSAWREPAENLLGWDLEAVAAVSSRAGCSLWRALTRTSCCFGRRLIPPFSPREGSGEATTARTGTRGLASGRRHTVRRRL